MSEKKPVITVGLASPLRKIRCESHAHMGELPCPWPGCPKGLEYDEFEAQLFGAEKLKHDQYYRREWLSLDGKKRYCWDIPDTPSWLFANKLAHEEILRSLPQLAPRPSRLYHYTTIDGLFGIVSSNHLWLTDYQYLNDSSELRFSLDIAGSSLERFDTQRYSPGAATLLSEWKEHLALTVPSCRLYVTSFSEDGDNLSLWRAYSPAGGVSLGFGTDLLSLMPLRDSFLNRIAYSPEDQQLLIDIVIHLHLLSVEWDLEKNAVHLGDGHELTKGFFSHILLRHLAFLKNPCFVDEREVRIAYLEDQEQFERYSVKKATRRFRPRGRLIVPYITSDQEDVGFPLSSKRPPLEPYKYKLPLEEVVVYPEQDSDLVIRGIEDFLAAHDFGDVTVNCSKIPFRRQ